MCPPYQRMSALDILDLYFIENRARLLDLASFLDRIDRYQGGEEARNDFRYKALLEGIEILKTGRPGRTPAIQKTMSDPTTEPLECALGLKAVGAWDGGSR